MLKNWPCYWTACPKRADKLLKSSKNGHRIDKLVHFCEFDLTKITNLNEEII